MASKVLKNKAETFASARGTRVLKCHSKESIIRIANSQASNSATKGELTQQLTRAASNYLSIGLSQNNSQSRPTIPKGSITGHNPKSRRWETRQLSSSSPQTHPFPV
ncbi:hypothetical protein TIFTF001_040702 [Ficus carica]|uniref:Uncharacterized protein n=1 Tax=Ficus carica TaxID=3494 RepID=A0AA88CQ90_FICCA|nr:hypothetical protein TIFTF001_040698 [Ficus carica]GMN25362.1 hypothetical protein TIFTF001_040702 [Ficus carica]